MKNTTRHQDPAKRAKHATAALENSSCYGSLRRGVLSTGSGTSRAAFDSANRHSKQCSVLQEDTSDVSKFATNPNVDRRLARREKLQPGRRHRRHCGRQWPARDGDSYSRGGNVIVSARPPSPARQSLTPCGLRWPCSAFEILKSDGTPIGTIVTNGFAAGAAPPGAPSSVTGTNFVITGGTGAFLGVRGQMGVAANPPGVAIQRVSLHDRRPREPPPQWRRNSTLDSPSDPDVCAANHDHSRRPRCDPFQRLLSRQCVQAGSGRGDPVALCKRSRPGQPGS